MKLRLKASGEIWDVDYISATNKDGLAGNFFSGYEIVQPDPETPQQSPHVEDLIASNTRAIDHNTSSIENLTSFGEGVLKRIREIESDNQRLKDRLNAIERQTRGEP